MSAHARQVAASRKESLAASRIPYAAHISDDVVCTHAGHYVQTLRLAGASFESADDETLNGWHERLNVAWRNIASANVSLWSHVIRRRDLSAGSVADGEGFANALARRYQERLAGEVLMLNEIYLSIVFRPVTGAAPSLFAKVLTRKASTSSAAERADALEMCIKLKESVSASLARYEPESLCTYEYRRIRCSRLLEFFSLLINGESARMPLPRAPVNEALATSRVLVGAEAIEYRTPTRTRFGAMLGIKEYPTPTVVGMFDTLLSAPFPFVLSQSFSFLAKATAQGLLQRQHARMGNAGDFAVTQANELIDALDALTSNEFVMGDHHFTLQVLCDHSVGRLNDSVALARTLLSESGMTVAREDLALEAAYWSQLPGNFSDRPRKAPVTSRNFSAMSGAHNFPTGRATGNHWGDALTLLITSARSPYHFSLHASDPRDPDGGSRKDTGHTFICGPTGSGKTVFVGFLVSMLARQGVTQVLFDKDHGLEILVRALRGTYLPLRHGDATGFNPLQLKNTPGNVEFLKGWLRSLVKTTTPLSIQEEGDLDHALHGTLSLDLQDRRLSRLIEFTDSTRPDGIYPRLSRWCLSTRGDYAWVFDNPDDTFADQMKNAALFGIDVTAFLENKTSQAPITLYLFHIVRSLLDGRRLVCWADEFSKLLADPAFEQFAKDGLKVWRKLNGVFAAATQSPSDALESSIARTIIEQTPTKILFPNADANESEYTMGFGLSQREFKLIKEQLEPGSRMFLVKQGHTSAVCQLDLKGFDAELAVISGRASAVKVMHELMDELGEATDQWLPRFLKMHSMT